MSKILTDLILLVTIMCIMTSKNWLLSFENIPECILGIQIFNAPATILFHLLMQCFWQNKTPENQVKSSGNDQDLKKEGLVWIWMS